MTNRIAPVFFEYLETVDGVQDLVLRPTSQALRVAHYVRGDLPAPAQGVQQLADNGNSILDVIQFPNTLIELGKRMSRLFTSIKERDPEMAIRRGNRVARKALFVSETLSGGLQLADQIRLISLSQVAKKVLSAIAGLGACVYLASDVVILSKYFKVIANSRSEDSTLTEEMRKAESHKVGFALLKIAAAAAEIGLSIIGVIAFALGMEMVALGAFLTFMAVNHLFNVSVYFYKKIVLAR